MTNETKRTNQTETETDKLARQIETEQIKLNKYKEQIALLQEKIKTGEDNLCRLKTARIASDYTAAESILFASGSTFKELIEALKEGDLLTLQEKIEKHRSGSGAAEENGGPAAASEGDAAEKGGGETAGAGRQPRPLGAAERQGEGQSPASKAEPDIKGSPVKFELIDENADMSEMPG